MVYDYSTKNKSFLDVYEQLKMRGIKNNQFFLALHDEDLIGVDPYDPSLSSTTKSKIIRECSLNIFLLLTRSYENS